MMGENTDPRLSLDGQPHGEPAGIAWEPGEEDYPFQSKPGETALDYLERWLDDAQYARIERGGIRYIHEVDVSNVMNHVTVDVALIRARLNPFGDHVLTAAEHKETAERLNRAITELHEALGFLGGPSPSHDDGG